MKQPVKVDADILRRVRIYSASKQPRTSMGSVFEKAVTVFLNREEKKKVK